MRGTVAKRLREQAMSECPYPSSYELLPKGFKTFNIGTFLEPAFVTVDCYQIRCVGFRRAYLDLKKAFKAGRRS